MPRHASLLIGNRLLIHSPYTHHPLEEMDGYSMDASTGGTFRAFPY